MHERQSECDEGGEQSGWCFEKYSGTHWRVEARPARDVDGKRFSDTSEAWALGVILIVLLTVHYMVFPCIFAALIVFVLMYNRIQHPGRAGCFAFLGAVAASFVLGWIGYWGIGLNSVSVFYQGQNLEGRDLIQEVTRLAFCSSGISALVLVSVAMLLRGVEAR